MAFFVKLTVIFFGSGFVTLLALWIAKEACEIPKLILGLYKNRKLKVNKENKISSTTGIYEVFFQDLKTTKIFSSHKGMKILN